MRRKVNYRIVRRDKSYFVYVQGKFLFFRWWEQVEVRHSRHAAACAVTQHAKRICVMPVIL